MWLIIGLGNPGRLYAKTRHNLGFLILDSLASKFSISLKNKTKKYAYGKGRIGEKDVILIKPLTFMNMSGIAVSDVVKKYADTVHLLVMHDDLDLEPGIIRIRKSGSSGGHRGIESIIGAIDTKKFLRLKVGIGRPEKIPAEEYVLKPFNKTERPVIKKAVSSFINHALKLTCYLSNPYNV
jgi:PTH1 family peptidyl-tRNA hydrolase